jgi:bifunctional DNA-binding transcriptional regulator/antitoxin component of YhaV-PrlF toxin-antitoxin module
VAQQGKSAFANCGTAELLLLIVVMTATLSISNRGDVTLPARMRKELGLHPNTLLIAEITQEGLLLRPAVTLPVEMYTDERIRAFDAENEQIGEIFREKGIA